MTRHVPKKPQLAAAVILLLSLHAHAGSLKEIRYVSSADGSEQPAMFYAPEAEKAIPLVVALHTWNGNYKQRYHKASIAAYEVLSKPCSAATSAEARWLLGRSLDIIGLPQLATLYYRDVVRFGRTAGDVAGDALVAWADAAVRLDDTQELVARLNGQQYRVAAVGQRVVA